MKPTTLVAITAALISFACTLTIYPTIEIRAEIDAAIPSYQITYPIPTSVPSVGVIDAGEEVEASVCPQQSYEDCFIQYPVPCCFDGGLQL